MNPLHTISVVPTKPIASWGVYGPFYPAKHCPFHSLCLGLALSPTCPAPLVSSLISLSWEPCTPLPSPRPAQHHLLRVVHPRAGQPCHHLQGPVPPSCSQKFSLNVTPVLLHLTSISHQSPSSRATSHLAGPSSSPASLQGSSCPPF